MTRRDPEAVFLQSDILVGRSEVMGPCVATPNASIDGQFRLICLFLRCPNQIRMNANKGVTGPAVFFCRSLCA